MNIQLNRNTSVVCCPRCRNNTMFEAHSEQVSEDCCEVWVVCKCGFDPHSYGDRYETPYGDTSRANVMVALSCWNDAIRDGDA